MLQSWVSQIGAGAVVVVCLYALVAGAWRERLGAVIYLAAYLVSLGFGLIAPAHSTLYLLLSDIFALQGFAVLAWKSPHPWPKWAVAGQVVCVAMEAITLMGSNILSWYFLTAEMLAGWGVLLALLLGTIAANAARRTRRIEGPDI